MASGERPGCPRCPARVDRMQASYGVVNAYPCGCWLTPPQARAVVAAARATVATEHPAEAAAPLTRHPDGAGPGR